MAKHSHIDVPCCASHRAALSAARRERADVMRKRGSRLEPETMRFHRGALA